MSRFFQTGSKQPIKSSVSLDYGSTGSTDSKRIKETQTSQDTRSALEILKEKMSHPPIEVWAGRLESKNNYKHVIHFIYKNWDEATAAATELQTNYGVMTCKGSRDELGVESSSMMKTTGASTYTERYGEEVCYLRIFAAKLSKLNISVDLNQIDYHPKSKPTPSSTPTVVSGLR